MSDLIKSIPIGTLFIEAHYPNPIYRKLARKTATLLIMEDGTKWRDKTHLKGSEIFVLSPQEMRFQSMLRATKAEIAEAERQVLISKIRSTMNGREFSKLGIKKLQVIDDYLCKAVVA
ncbi:MAG: hypothetical protein HRU28_08540 [Rhizobiales bacterium]|nr:hypothetical protein [Hyphomicrobiales bacterium]